MFPQVFFAQQPCSSGYIGNGVDEFIEIPNTTYINANNTAVANRTIEFWFKASDITTKQVLFEEGGGVNAIYFFLESDRLYLGQYSDNANASTKRRLFRTGSGDIETDTWYHVAMTLDSGSTLKWYLNGVEKDSQTGFTVKKHTGDINFGRSGGNLKYPSSLVSNWNASSIGSSTTETYNNTFTGNDNTKYYFTGNISLFRIWNVARTDSEIDTNKSTYLTSGTDLVAYQNGEKIHYRASSDSGIDSEIIADDSDVSYTWTGGSSNVWSATANWSGGSNPDADNAQTIVVNNGSNNPDIIANTLIGSLTVDASATVTIKSGGTLNVYYNLVNNGTIVVEDGGSLIFHSCVNAVTGSGTFTVNQNSPAYSAPYFYSYWGSPLVETDSDPSVLFPSQPVVYKFNSSVASSDWADNAGADLIPGVGYAIRVESAGSFTPIMDGKINETGIDIPVYFTTNADFDTDPDNVWSEEGDNLLGNPYTSALDWDLIIQDTDNDMLDGTVYFWDQQTVEVGDNHVSDYKQYNLTGGGTNTATGKIGLGQGFFVRTTVNGTVNLKKTHQVAGENTQFFRKAAKLDPKKDGRSWFSLRGNNKFSSTLVGFVDGATRNYDRLYDSPFDVNNTVLGLYSLVEGAKKATIQGLPKLKKKKKVVKLGFVVDKVGEYTIKVDEEHIKSKYYIYLRDKEQEITTDLRLNSYTFNVDSIGENNTRFKLIYTKKRRKASNQSVQNRVVPSIDEAKEFLAFVTPNKKLMVEYDLDEDNVNSVILFDIQGRAVSTFRGSALKDVSHLKTGLYILDVITNDNERITKKILITN
ncbi:LamG-like jellyroll fold domain-containing protein [Lutibacter sp. Hel_I_33_5]|uniref:LamG-like jellyroll fold domain-containing protein n=1 Tax=Lutibacter sp. Hel_I_33_5 TaxID=1566289 RepID=UPI001644A9DD|nr:LamG-like jellyroll fold domain-containing protein [Lutibacter sp. Hel_I_33_5]